MNKFTLVIFFVLLNSALVLAQKGVISGKVTDAATNETLIGVNILYGKGLGINTDINGEYSLELPYGSYTLNVSYVGYISQTLVVKIGSSPSKHDFSLQNITLSEVNVVGDVARARETPVAFSTVTPRQIQEQLAGRDIPMLLNSTPGVYATQMGGGEGDARITIRGFNDRNVGVLLDGVPVNDMENGIVYWSNWFGLDAVTRSIQVQRGLGASKLALPSVGGTINIITKGIDERKGGMVSEEFNSEGSLKASFGYNSGRLAHGFGFTLAGSHKAGNGWVDHTWSDAWFFYGKIDKVIGKHILSVSAYGAPQSHNQRSYNLPAAVYDKQWALDHGVDSLDLTQYTPGSWLGSKYTFDHGTRFNQHWGEYEMYTLENYGKLDSLYYPLPVDTINRGRYRAVNERTNEFFKPQITIKDFWTINDKLSLSNIAYISIGRGGGIRAKNTVSVLPSGEINFQKYRDLNTFTPVSENNLYSTTLRDVGSINNTNYLVERVNEHEWYGLLSTFNYLFSPQITMSGGLDLRTYKGVHYEKLYNLLGADYLRTAEDHSQIYVLPNGDYDYPKAMKFTGDKEYYYNDGLVRWGGFFYQAEYKEDKVTAFINITGARTGYKRVDHFQYDSLQETAWKWINGWTIKGGGNYNLSKHLSAFVNLGYLNKAPRFSNVFDNNNNLYREIKNEKVEALEAGLAYSSRSLSVNLNAYYTVWQNRPVETIYTVPVTDSIPDPNHPGTMLPGNTVYYTANINGLAALHKGVELQLAYSPFKKLKIQGIFSLGDWIWNSADTVRLLDDYGKMQGTAKYFNAKGIHVGNAAQFQVGADVRFEPVRDLYISGNITYFGKYYSNFDPMSYDQADPNNKDNFDSDGNPVDPWIIPSFYLVDFHIGYKIKVAEQSRIQLRFNMLNALDTVYVTDADDNSRNIGQNWSTHDARSAAVFFGFGRRYTMSLEYQF
jgi:iron complex outermembrane recepter protein